MWTGAQAYKPCRSAKCIPPAVPPSHVRDGCISATHTVLGKGAGAFGLGCTLVSVSCRTTTVTQPRILAAVGAHDREQRLMVE